MATKISTDIASVVDITCRRNDSFYLKSTLTKQDGSAYNLTGISNSENYKARLNIYDANDVNILSFTSETDALDPYVNDTITVNASTSEIEIKVNASHMGIRSGSYKYKLYVWHDGDNETNTIMIGKFKVVDI